MEAVKIEAKRRDNTKKEASKRYRREGLIPSVLYGQGNNINLLINGNEFNKIYHKLTKSTLINLNIDNEEFEVLIKDYHKDNIKDKFIHIDFYELKKGKRVHTKIHLEFVGTSSGVKEGGILEKQLIAIDVECLPKDMVSHFDINVEHLGINDTLHVSDLEIDKEKYKVLNSQEESVVHISGVTEEVEEVEVIEEAVVAEEAAADESATEKEEDKKEE